MPGREGLRGKQAVLPRPGTEGPWGSGEVQRPGPGRLWPHCSVKARTRQVSRGSAGVGMGAGYVLGGPSAEVQVLG